MSTNYMKMDPTILCDTECVSSGLQMLLDRWRLQEEKLQVFEESLKEVNKSMMYQPNQKNLEASNSKIVLQSTLSALSDCSIFGTSVQARTFCITCAQSTTSSEDNFGYSICKGNYEGEEIHIPIDLTNNESMEEFEKKIWETVCKDKVFINDNVVNGSYHYVLEVIDTYSKNDLQKTSNEIAQLHVLVPLRSDLQFVENTQGKEVILHSFSQEDFQGQIVRALHFTAISNDNFATLDLKVKPQNLIYMCSKDVDNDHQPKIINSEDSGILIESSNKFSLVCEKVESLRMAVNLVSHELWSLSKSNEEFSNFNELSNQKAHLIGNIMAFESQRHIKREKEQLRRNEALKQEEEATAHLKKVFKNQLKLEQEEKHASKKEYLREQISKQEERVEEFQQELESNNAYLKKLTNNWEIFGKENELKTHNVEEYIKFRRLEEERRNTAAQRISRAFKKRRCKMLNKCCTSIQKVVRGFFSRRKVQELKGQRCKMMEVLTAAVEEGSMNKLNESSLEAQKLGLHKELDLMKLDFARKRIVHLYMCDETFQSQSPPQVQALLMEGKSMGLEDEKLKELFKLMAKSRDVALKQLTQIAKVGKWNEYESCLETAWALGLEKQVDVIQERWEAAKMEVSRWSQQVASSWGIGSQVVFEKAKEAQRLGLTTLAETIQANVFEKENNVLVGLKTSTMTGVLRAFHAWLQTAKLFNMKKAVKKYSIRFRQRVVKVQKQLMQAPRGNYEEKSLKQLLLEGSRLGLETEMAIVIRHIRWQILMFVKQLINYEQQSINREDDFFGKWKELHWQGQGFEIEIDILEDLLKSIESSISLKHTSIKRFIVASFECDLMGFPLNYVCEIQKTFLKIKALTLECNSTSNSQACAPAKNQCSTIGIEKCTFWKTLPLATYCISWHEMDKLRCQWKQQYLQPFLEVLASRSLIGGGLEIAKKQPKDGNANLGLWWSNNESYTKERRNVGMEQDIEEVVLDCGNENGNGDDDYWHTPQSPFHSMQPLATCTLTRKIIEVSAHCNQKELLKIVKLNIMHKDLTSLGVGILGRWCPKLQIFMMDENRVNTLKGAFHGCERSLEYVLVKGNLLNDFKGLELLQNLKVLLLRGNFISYIGPGIEAHIDSKVIDGMVETGPKVTTTTSKSNYLCTSPRALCQSWQGTPRFFEDKNDPCDCLTFRNSHLQHIQSLWPRLKKLCLGNNRINRVWKLGSLCPNLEVLDLVSNELVTLGGCEGQALAGLKNLRILNVGQNKIKGESLWKGFNHCPLLVSLIASGNQLTELPTHLGSVMLREIWLNGNSITCLACKAWLPNLQRFYLQDNLINNLESLWGCPSLEVLDISFNNVADLSQLNHLSSFRRLRILQMNDNPVSDQEEHVDKVLEAVPWLIELDNEPIEDSFRENLVKSIFLKNMDVVGIQYLHEKIAQAEEPFLFFVNPKDVARQWLDNSNSFSNQCNSTSSTTFASHWGNIKATVMNRNVIEIMHGKAKGAILWAAIFALHQMVGTSLILKAQLISSIESNLGLLESLPCHSTMEENWNYLAFQEMFESHKKSNLWSKETILQKEFSAQSEGKFRPQTTEKGINNFGKDIMAEFQNIDKYLADHLEYTACKYQNVYNKNMEYKIEIEAQLSKVKLVQALGRGMLARKSKMRMKKLAVDALVAQRIQQLLDKQRFLTSVLQIQAAWRRWIGKKHVKSATKLQAFWRGFFIRKRFQQALSSLPYIDNDDFEYVAIDEDEFVLNFIIYEDEVFLFSKLQALDELNIGDLHKSKTSFIDALLITESINKDHVSFLSKSHDIYVDKHKDEMDIVALSRNQSSDMQIQCEETKIQSQSIKKTIESCSCPHLSKKLDASKLTTNPLVDNASNLFLSNEGEASVIFQSEDYKTLVKEIPKLTSQSWLQQFTARSSLEMKAHICGKDLRAEKKKVVIVEIAKDWGFKEKKTAESYMKARAKILKKLEKEKFVHQGAQSRFDLFRARSGEALAYSSSQRTYVKQTAHRVLYKVEKEMVPIPFEDISLVEKTFNSWNPPATFPALKPHVRQAHLKKEKLRNNCPTWAPPSTGNCNGSTKLCSKWK